MGKETTSSGSATSARRTQEERRAATRLKLLRATIGAIEELGYANTTTTAVCERAGVSQGALFKHFRRKADLVAAAAAYLFDQIIGDYRVAFRRMQVETDGSSEAANALLWKTFRSPRVLAAFDLYTAARTDPHLANALEPVVARNGENLLEAAHELYPGFEDDLEFEALTALTLFALEGAALNHIAHPDEKGVAAMLAYLNALSREKVERGRKRGSPRRI